MLIKFQEYLTLEKSLKPKSVYEYTNVLNACKDPLSFTEYHQVTNALFTAAQNRGWSNRMRYKAATILKVFYRWALREKLIDHNPFPFHDFKRPGYTEPDFFSDEEMPQILFNPRYTLQEMAMVNLLADTGIRAGELCTLNAEDVNLKDRFLHIKGSRTKTDTYRFVPFSRRTRTLLRAYMNTLKLHYKGEALFPSAKWGRFRPESLWKMVSRLGEKETPLKPAIKTYPHKFRHSFAGNAISNGAPETAVAKMLGHSNLNQTFIYTHFQPKQIKKIHDKFVRIS